LRRGKKREKKEKNLTRRRQKKQKTGTNETKAFTIIGNKGKRKLSSRGNLEKKKMEGQGKTGVVVDGGQRTEKGRYFLVDSSTESGWKKTGGKEKGEVGQSDPSPTGANENVQKGGKYKKLPIREEVGRELTDKKSVG